MYEEYINKARADYSVAAKQQLLDKHELPHDATELDAKGYKVLMRQHADEATGEVYESYELYQKVDQTKAVKLEVTFKEQ